jgi:DNA polymerase-1
VRPDWYQIGAPTGRMATSDPNVLGLPKDERMRACIVAPPGRVFVVADYAAIELRALAHVTGDPRLSGTFRDGGDPHRELAAILVGKDPSAVTSDERKRAKPVAFGFAFGMGAQRFVSYALKDYGVSFTLTEAQRFRSAYLGAYREVDVWQRETRARMNLEVRTCAGRVRTFANRKDGYTERLNMPIQGTAADGMKRAMALLGPRLARLDARIVLAVHDELVVEAPEEAAEEVKAVTERGMIEGMAVDVDGVPIVVEAEIRKTWGAP